MEILRVVELEFLCLIDAVYYGVYWVILLQYWVAQLSSSQFGAQFVTKRVEERNADNN